MPVNRDNLEHVFTYHAPKGPEQLEAYQKIREAGKNLAAVIFDNTPFCGDQQAAIRKVREAVMTANACIALEGGI